MGILMTLVSLYITIKIAGFLFSIVGKLLGSVLGFIVVICVAAFAVKLIGFALIVIPFVLIAGGIGIAAKAAMV